MTTNMHLRNLPKIVQIGGGHHVDFFFFLKKSAITFGEGYKLR